MLINDNDQYQRSALLVLEPDLVESIAPKKSAIIATAVRCQSLKLPEVFFEGAALGF